MYQLKKLATTAQVIQENNSVQLQSPFLTAAQPLLPASLLTAVYTAADADSDCRNRQFIVKGQNPLIFAPSLLKPKAHLGDSLQLNAV